MMLRKSIILLFLLTGTFAWASEKSNQKTVEEFEVEPLTRYCLSFNTLDLILDD